MCGYRRGRNRRRSRSGQRTRGPQKDPIIVQVMSKQNIEPRNVPATNFAGPFDNPDNFRGSKRFFRVKGFAWFCKHGKPVCSYTWASAHAWCVVDLRNQEFVHKYSQKCKKCNNWNIKPIFEGEAKRRMAEHACKIYLCRIGELEWSDPAWPNMEDLSGRREGEHDMSGCEMCRILGQSCFAPRDGTAVESSRMRSYARRSVDTKLTYADTTPLYAGTTVSNAGTTPFYADTAQTDSTARTSRQTFSYPTQQAISTRSVTTAATGRTGANRPLDRSDHGHASRSNGTNVDCHCLVVVVVGALVAICLGVFLSRVLRNNR